MYYIKVFLSCQIIFMHCVFSIEKLEMSVRLETLNHGAIVHLRETFPLLTAEWFCWFPTGFVANHCKFNNNTQDTLFSTSINEMCKIHLRGLISSYWQSCL